MLSLSIAANIEKNKLASSAAWILLLEIALKDGTVIRVAQDEQDVVWNNQTWTAFNFELDEISHKSATEVPRVAVKVSNVSRVLEPYLEAGAGGVGATVKLYVVHSKLLAETKPITELTFMCTGASVDSRWATFQLGAANPFRRRFPQNRFLKNFCRFRFKSSQCGYSGSATSCDKSLAACRARGNSKRFGGFPSVGKGAVYA